MAEHTRRQFFEVAAATAAATLLAPPALADPGLDSRPCDAPAPCRLATPCRPGRSVRQLPVRDLHRRDERGHRADLHHEPVRPRSRCAGRAVRGCAPAPARVGGRRRRRASERAGSLHVADRPTDVHRPRRARPQHDGARRRDAGPGHPRPGRDAGLGHTPTARSPPPGRQRGWSSPTSTRRVRAGRSRRSPWPRRTDRGGSAWTGLRGSTPMPCCSTRAQGHRVHPPRALSPAARAGPERRSRRSAGPGTGRSSSAASRTSRTRGRRPVVASTASVVSNERGRRGPGVGGTIRVLPRIADAVGGRLSVLFGSGARTGTDVFRALALGADAVVVGRRTPMAWRSEGRTASGTCSERSSPSSRSPSPSLVSGTTATSTRARLPGRERRGGTSGRTALWNGRVAPPHERTHLPRTARSCLWSQ